jgi:cytoskeletal protein RodZ
MTTRDEARRGTKELRPGTDEARPSAASASDTSPSLPERLYAARERKGVDLYRAERDTKIRSRYLAALERGDYKELPGAVYTKGFLRNYALYLGLDPDEILVQWRRERGDGAPAQQVISVPRPIAPPRRGLTFSPGVVVAALLTVVVLLFGAYLASQILRYNKPPTITVTTPAVATLTVDEGTTTYVLMGTTIPGGTVTVEAPGGSRQASADSTGAWSVEVDLRRGKNTFKIDATDPETGKHPDQTAQVVITVPYAQIEAPVLTVDQPADGTTLENGAIPVQGTATNATSVSVSATYDGPVGGAVGNAGASPPPAPPPVDVTVADDGTFNTPLQLTTGRWSIIVTATGASGKTTSPTHHVTVAFKGVNLVVAIKGSPAWIKVWVDGKLSTLTGSGKTYQAGKTIAFTGTTSVEVRTGSSGATFFTLNGEAIGALGKRGVPEVWLFQPPDGPKKTQHQ